MKKIAVVLSGCGVFDGSEIHEAVMTLLAIEKCGLGYQCFAPNIAVNNPINSHSQDHSNTNYNVLEMSARIARGKILPLSEFNADEFDGIMFPGGMGAVKNLCDFAVKGADCTVNAEVASAVRTMNEKGKVIGAICIAPVLIAKILGKGILTIGNDPSTASVIEKMGATHEKRDAHQTCVDAKNKIVTSPAYMLASGIAEVEQSAFSTIFEMSRMM